MTTTTRPVQHHKLHIVNGYVRPVLAGPAVDAPGMAAVIWHPPGEVSAVYRVPVSELRSGALPAPKRFGLRSAQRDVARYRFEDVRDGSPADDELGAELVDGDLVVTHVGDALATLELAADILLDKVGPGVTRERKATESLRAKIAKLVTG